MLPSRVVKVNPLFPTNIFHAAELAAWWLPNYIQQPSSRPLVDKRGLGTEKACLHYPASGTRAETNSATGVGGVEASGWLLKARTSESESEKTQRRVRG